LQNIVEESKEVKSYNSNDLNINKNLID